MGGQPFLFGPLSQHECRTTILLAEIMIQSNSECPFVPLLSVVPNWTSYDPNYSDLCFLKSRTSV